MSNFAQQGSGSVNIGGKDVNITVNLDSSKTLKKIHLADETKIDTAVEGARAQMGKDLDTGQQGVASFSNPKQNAYKLGFYEGMKVADFGAGSGMYTTVLSDVVGTTGTVYAVDVQKDLLTRIQNNATREGRENIKIVWGDIEVTGSIGIKDELLDGVLFSNTLFQLEDKISAVKEAWRVLRKGGALAVIDWKNSFEGLGPKHDMVITKSEAMVLCTDNGFTLKNEFNAGEHHYGLIFIKMMDGENQDDVLVSSKEEDNDFVARTIAQELA